MKQISFARRKRDDSSMSEKEIFILSLLSQTIEPKKKKKVQCPPEGPSKSASESESRMSNQKLLIFSLKYFFFTQEISLKTLLHNFFPKQIGSELEWCFCDLRCMNKNLFLLFFRQRRSFLGGHLKLFVKGAHYGMCCASHTHIPKWAL